MEYRSVEKKVEAVQFTRDGPTYRRSRAGMQAELERMEGVDSWRIDQPPGARYETIFIKFTDGGGLVLNEGWWLVRHEDGTPEGSFEGIENSRFEELYKPIENKGSTAVDLTLSRQELDYVIRALKVLGFSYEIDGCVAYDVKSSISSARRTNIEFTKELKERLEVL